MLPRTNQSQKVRSPTAHINTHTRTHSHTDTHIHTQSNVAGNGECVELIGGKQKEEKKTLTHNTDREKRRERRRGVEREEAAGRDVDHNNTKVKLVENANTNRKKRGKASGTKNGTRKYRHSCLLYITT